MKFNEAVAAGVIVASFFVCVGIVIDDVYRAYKRGKDEQRGR